jgi:hypothetical protein
MAIYPAVILRATYRRLISWLIPRIAAMHARRPPVVKYEPEKPESTHGEINILPQDLQFNRMCILRPGQVWELAV